MANWCIDAGHGAKDPGATNAVATEKSLNLIVALEVARLLREHGETVILTRDHDKYLSLSQRTAVANKAGVDYLISVHHNGGGGDGSEVIYPIEGGEGKRLAELVAQEFKAIGQNNRRIFSRELRRGDGTITDYYGMIRMAKMPSIITEFGFVDNAKDFAQFDEHHELLLEAEAIAKACLLFVGKPFRNGLDLTLALVAKKGYINSPNYWLNVLRGNTEVNLEYLRILFENIARDS